jgi:hypothetical protein
MLAPVLAAVAGLAATQLPYSRTPAAALQAPGLAHHEVLRIGRDFGDRNFEVVVDSWTSTAHPDALDEVRFWWVDGSNDDERSPFGKKLRKYIGMDLIPVSADDWTVKLRGDRKEFLFRVVLEPEGTVAAYGDVLTAEGRTVPHCRATHGRFVARRLLGIPIGIKRLDVRCVDAEGRTHDGELPFRKLPRGALWDEA